MSYFHGENDLRAEEVEALLKAQQEYAWLHLTNHSLLENQEPQIMVEGQGCYIKDARGKEYLDMLSGGVWCVNVGYGRETLVEAAARQLRTLPYYAGSVANPPYIRLAEKMASLLPAMPRLYVSNSGSEANEKTFKMARLYFRIKYPHAAKYKIIYRDRDYHGSTLAVLSAGGQEERKNGFGPLLEGFVKIPHACCYRCQFNKEYPGCGMECAYALEEVIKKEGADSVAAVILEPITAGGGIIPPVPEYFPIIQKICRQYEVLLILDEVVNGFGRTGKMFGYQHYDVDPDMISMAKGLASSYMPLAGTAAKTYIFDQFLAAPEDYFGYFRDISTYGGCAAACSTALENIRIIEEEELVENSAVVGRYLMEELSQFKNHPLVGDIRGKGLLVGLELVEDKKTKAPVQESIMAGIVGDVKNQGYLIGRMGRSVPGYNNVLTLAPALIITKEQVDEVVNALGNALTRLK
ncbi:Taurine-pyruvate aminotransferase [Propionispora sp. 2/2-37]|uniref:aminotransferase family protein n=1 Tax=Propionispora sp. 2/2-37 TaxID=1677858 RepID=UPI0006BB5BCA|nr:aminotransferase [Propionispora sp. 2/2-37]CUH96811.1 Taurine-pyruvate aminotransferase [Propionispora sp. 2/2-37]